MSRRRSRGSPVKEFAKSLFSVMYHLLFLPHRTFQCNRFRDRISNKVYSSPMSGERERQPSVQDKRFFPPPPSVIFLSVDDALFVCRSSELVRVEPGPASPSSSIAEERRIRRERERERDPLRKTFVLRNEFCREWIKVGRARYTCLSFRVLLRSLYFFSLPSPSPSPLLVSWWWQLAVSASTVSLYFHMSEQVSTTPDVLSRNFRLNIS